MKKNLFRILAALIVVGLAVALIWIMTRAPLRAIEGITAIGQDNAIILNHAVGSDEIRYFAQLVQVDGKTRWEAELTPLRTVTGLHHDGVAADATQVYLLVQGPEGAAVVALGRDDGKERWRAMLPKGAEPNLVSRSLMVDENRLLAFHSVRGPNGEPATETITAFNTKDGSVLWPTAATPRIQGQIGFTGAIVSAGRLVAHPRVTTEGENPKELGIEVDTRTGLVVRSLPMLFGYCNTPYGVVAHGAEGLQILTWSGKGFEEPRLLMKAADYGYGGLSAPCGVHRDNVIIGFKPPPVEAGAPRTLTLAAIHAETGIVRWTRVFENGDDFVAMRGDGPLPRFLAVATTVNAVSKAHVHIVDLTNGEVVKETQEDGQMTIATTDTRALFNVDAPTRALTAVNPDNGALGVTIKLNEPGAFKNPLRAIDVASAKLWTYLDLEASADALPWIVMDLKSPTLDMLHPKGEVVD